MMPKSRRKGKFIFLKQILEESMSDKGPNEVKKEDSDASSKSESSAQPVGRKKVNDNAGPIGTYPVLFSKRSKSKSCQTKLSSFPLFPLPGETEWISDDGEETKRKVRGLWKKKKKKDRSNVSSTDLTAKENNGDSPRAVKVKNSDGSRKEFKSEHQLKETDNPLLKTWLHRKNIMARKQRKLERKEKRAKKAALEEESRLNEERMIECNEKVGEWFKRKQKEARMARRRSRAKVSPQEVEVEPETTASRPSTAYRVVKSFQCAKPSASTQVMDPNNVEVMDSSKTTTGNMSDTTSVAKQQNTIFPTQSVQQNHTGLHSQNKTKGDAKYDSEILEKEKHKPRPKTASVKHSTLSASPSAPKAAVNRPKTAGEIASRTSMKKGSSVAGDASKKMQSMTYDEWLRTKRDDDKTKHIQKRRELIDSHLQAVIAELGKKRVEKIMSPRKCVDTGLYNAAPKPSATPQAPSTKMRKSVRYRWVSSKDPRPEPQGCDHPESQLLDGSVALAVNQQGASLQEGKCEDHDVKETSFESLDHDENSTCKPGSSTQPKVPVCPEIDEKYWELKPSIEKVKVILDSEIKKLKGAEKRREKGLVHKHDPQSLDLMTEHSDATKTLDSALLRPQSARPKTARPISARPTSARPCSTYLTKEQSKKIASDLDILGLCGSDSEHEDDHKVDAEDTDKSTVRENYFDYGSDADPPTMEPTKLL